MGSLRMGLCVKDAFEQFGSPRVAALIGISGGDKNSSGLKVPSPLISHTREDAFAQLIYAQLGSCVVANSVSFLHDSAQVSEVTIDQDTDTLRMAVWRVCLWHCFVSCFSKKPTTTHHKVKLNMDTVAVPRSEQHHRAACTAAFEARFFKDVRETASRRGEV